MISGSINMSLYIVYVFVTVQDIHIIYEGHIRRKLLSINVLTYNIDLSKTRQAVKICTLYNVRSLLLIYVDVNIF